MQDLEEYDAACRKKIAIAERSIENKGFWGNLKDVFKL